MPLPSTFVWVLFVVGLVAGDVRVLPSCSEWHLRLCALRVTLVARVGASERQTRYAGFKTLFSARGATGGRPVIFRICL